jgi:hypothetical protein
MNFHKKIFSLVGFVYFNIYAFILLVVGIGVYFIPINVFILILKITLSILLFVGSFNIFMTWNRKQRILNLLLAKNKEEIKFESFKPFMHDLCTQLIVLYVLIKKKNVQIFFRLFFDEIRCL